MNHFWIRLWRSVRFPLLVACATVPVPLLVSAYLMPEMLQLMWLWPAGYVIMDAIGTVIRKKWRILYGAISLMLIAAGTVPMVILTENVRIFFVPVLYSALLLIGLTRSAMQRNERVQPIWYALGVAVHLVAQLLLYTATNTGNLYLLSLKPWILACFFCFVLLALVTLNQGNLQTASAIRQAAPRSIRRKNLLLTLAFFGITVAIALIPAVVSAISSFFSWLFFAIRWLYGLLIGEDQGAGGAGGPGTQPGFPDAGPAREGMPQWLQMIFAVAGLLLAVAVTLWLVYFLIKKLIAGIKLLGRLLGQYLQAVSEDYVDEITDTREELNQAVGRTAPDNRQKSRPNRAQTPEQRIRYRYRQLMHRHPEWESGSTARENLNEEAASIYEYTRYSGRPVDEDKARTFAAETRKLPSKNS